MYVNVDSKKSIRFIDGWLELQIADNSWQRYWCVLRDDVIILFNSQKETKDATVGTISIGPGSRLEKLGGDERLGFTFRLYTKRSLNNFKTAKAIDLEMWKAYVEGIACGDVCDDIDLLPGLIEDVRIKLKQFFINKLPARIPNKVSPAGVGNLKTGFDTPDGSTSGSYYDTTGYLVPYPYQRRPSINYVAQKYRFYSDPSKTDVPHWFFSSCSRELAEKVLTVAGAYGNTLIRENNNDSKNLRISKRTESSSGHVFTHYIIQVTPLGYKIDVENPHEPKQTLSEVMEFFIETSGRSTTRPMTCNDLKLFGLGNYTYNDYNTKIVTTHHDVDSGEDIADGEASGYSSRSFGINPPAMVAPPPPHLKATKPAITKGPLAFGGFRSPSAPNIQVPMLLSEQSHAAKQSQTLSKSSGIQNSHILRTNTKEVRDTSVIPPLPSIPQKVPTSSHQNAPPLPPNHPPPLQKANSQSAIKVTPDILNTNTNKAAPKHTQSVSSADMQVRKISPRDQQAALQAKDELAQVTARIIKQTEPPEILPKPTESSKAEIQKEAIKSPAAASGSFKKKLEELIANPHALATKSPLQSQTEDQEGCYESISHYQNAIVIQNNRK